MRKAIVAFVLVASVVAAAPPASAVDKGFRGLYRFTKADGCGPNRTHPMRIRHINEGVRGYGRAGYSRRHLEYASGRWFPWQNDRGLKLRYRPRTDTAVGVKHGLQNCSWRVHLVPIDRALSAIGSSHAVATPDMLRRASCPEGGRQRPILRRLALTDNGNQIKVRLDVHGPRSQGAVLWNVGIRHDGVPFLRLRRFRTDGGNHTFQRRVLDRDGIDRFWARARIVANGPGGLCTVHARI